MSANNTQVLLPYHLDQLHASAISDSVIAARGYQSVPETGGYPLLKQHGFSNVQAKTGAQGGLILPLWTPTGDQPVVVLRPDHPREDKNGRPHKYEIPTGARVRIDVPPICRPMLGNPEIPLWITEGQKKVDSLASRDACAIGLLSVWGFKGKNDIGGLTVTADLDEIAWNGRDVRLVFDSDVVRNQWVSRALDRLTQVLKNRKANVHVIYLPEVDGHKVGVDDYLADGRTLADLEALIEAPRPKPQPAPPTMELLSASPKSITRPLTLVDGHGYATTWLWARLTTTETVTKHGEIVRLPEPRIEDRLERFIIRDDGVLYGDIADPNVNPLRDITVHLPEPPPPNKLWSPAGVQAYLRGERPDPKTVFEQVTNAIDSFIDFNRSLADQRTMCELVACYTLSTWFLEALRVIGYLWPNGERGSGKTQLLNIVTEMAYLGQTILAGGSYAALRDLADYGATLAFDDAEAVMDVRKTDPDKRALLLAGNRKGNTTPVKEPVNGREWRTRYVNTFCPRLFSAIRMPDPVLASRTIVVPLIRTADRHKANADPLNYALWPYPRERMLDDLWALGLAHIGTITQHADRASQNATLSGRALEPWLAILTVASWLDDQGCAGMFQKMDDLSLAYQKERPDLEMADLTVLVVRSLVEVATGKSIKSITSVASIKVEGSGGEETKKVTTAGITEQAKSIAENEGHDTDIDRITSRRVGRVLAKLRLKKDPDTSTRQWLVTTETIAQLALSFGLFPAEVSDDKDPVPPAHNACNAFNACNACSAADPERNEPCTDTHWQDEPLDPNRVDEFAGDNTDDDEVAEDQDRVRFEI